MNDLVSQDHGPERIERMDDVLPGQYWRALRDVETGSADKWGLSSRDIRTVPAGRILLLKEVRFVDGRVHTIVLRRHPTDTEGSDHALLAADFHAAFEPAHDGAQVRDREILEAQDNVEAARRLISAGPSNSDLALPAPSHAPSVSTALTAPGSVDKARREAARHALVAQKHAEWLAARNQEMAGAIEVMADFYKERSDAALASVQEHIRYAEHLNEGVRNLELYTGENVEVSLLCDGEEADPAEQLTLFQRKLYMDEEYAVHLHRGGADWTDLDGFAKSLADDPVLLDRIIPAQRGVVVMAYRRSGKDYLSGKTFEGFAEQFSAVLEAASQNAVNRETFLLVRNGRRVHKVFSEVASDRTERLFPTRTEADKPFRGWDGEHIGLDDLRFTDALSKHEETARHYKRLLVLLWGLNDRLGLFGRFYDPGKYRNFGSLDLQNDRFRFVYDDDEETLPSNRPSFWDFVKKANAFLQPGSRVACLWPELITPDTAPSCASWMGRYQDSVFRRYSPDEKFAVATARKRGDDIGVEAEVSGSDSKGRERRFTAWVSLRPAGRLSFLVLDTIRLEDVEYYVESRHERRSYLSYLWLFTEVRKALLADREREAPARRELEEAVSHISESPAGIVAETVRMWRAANAGRSLPLPEDADWKRTMKGLLNQAFVLAGKDRDLAKDAAALMESQGRTPLRLVMTGSGRIEIYASSAKDEVEERLGGSPWVRRIRLARLKDGLVPETASWTLLPKFSASETTLHEWAEAAALAGADAPGNLAYEDAKRLLDLVDGGPDMAKRMLRPLSATEIRDLINEYCEPLRQKMTTGKMVNMPGYAVPVGVTRGRSNRLNVVVAFRRCDRYLHAAAADGLGREEVYRWLRSVYQRPDTHIEALRKSQQKPFALGIVDADVILGRKFWSDTTGLLRDGDNVRIVSNEYGPGLARRIKAVNKDRHSDFYPGEKIETVYLPAESDQANPSRKRTGKSPAS